jgi:hypothetical protein
MANSYPKVGCKSDPDYQTDEVGHPQRAQAQLQTVPASLRARGRPHSPLAQQPNLHRQSEGQNWDGWEEPTTMNDQPVPQPYRSLTVSRYQHHADPYANPYYTEPEQPWNAEGSGNYGAEYETVGWGSTRQRPSHLPCQPHSPDTILPGRPDLHYHDPRSRLNREAPKYPSTGPLCEPVGFYAHPQAGSPPPYAYAAAHAASMHPSIVDGRCSQAAIGRQDPNSNYGYGFFIPPAPRPGRASSDVLILRPPSFENTFPLSGVGVQGILRSRSEGRASPPGNQNRSFHRRGSEIVMRT